MRLVKVAADAALTEKILETAFAAGLDEVTLRQVERHTSDGRPPGTLQIVDVETSTPQAKRFVDMLLSADYYDPQRVTLNTRQPRSLINDKSVRELTEPLVEPSSDLYQELWQFSHITFGLVGRVLFGGGLLAYGLIEGKILLIISGLLFLPLLPPVMAISYGIMGRQRSLALQGALALATCAALLFISGVLLAFLSSPPMRFADTPALLTGFIISIGVGAAATLAAEDDTGRRELIGLAAGAQIGMLPVILGIRIVFGSWMTGPGPMNLAAMFGLNVATIIVSAMVTQYVTGVIGSIRRVRSV
jgi:hypothetical protein